jgi:enoyl-[acyl-carrier protein] reductase I
MEKPWKPDLTGRRILVTGIADHTSLALRIARELLRQGALPICTGLGPAPGRRDLSDRAQNHLRSAFESFCKTVEAELGPDVPTWPCDVSNDESIAALAGELRACGLELDGVLHAVAFDRTLRRGSSTTLLETPRDAFLECMNVSAYSLIAILRAIVERGLLRPGASVVALSYLGASRVVSHPYRNVGVAKAALERIARQLAVELGRSHDTRVNVVRFSPYSASRAGGAIPGLQETVEHCELRSPLGNALPEALALEVAHLMRPGTGITGETRHVDGGYHALA